MKNEFNFTTHTLIIGGGPSGSTLARFLAKGGIDTILCEKNFDYDKPCSGAVRTNIFDLFEIPKNLETQKINTITLRTKKDSVDINLDKNSLSIVSRKEFDKKLRELSEEQGARLLEAKYVHSNFFDDYIVSTLKTKNELITIKSKYLVAADGVNSTVRREILSTQTDAFLTHYSIIKDKKLDKCTFYYGSDYSPNAYLWQFPHKNNISLGSIIKNQDSKIKFENIKKSNQMRGKTKGFYIPSWNNEKIFYKNRVFFVGDSAGQVLPFTYEGIYFAMFSAYTLAQAIVEDNPSLYELQWTTKYEEEFRLFAKLEKIFLKNDFCANLMLKLFKNKTLQAKIIDYWFNNKQITLGNLFLKIIKYSIRK